MQVTLAAPWLDCDLGAPHRVLSWAPHRPGYQIAQHIQWRQVRNADLPADLDVAAWLAREMAGRDAVCLLTSRDIAHHHLARATVEDVTAETLATVGLSNAETVGARVDRAGRNWDKVLPSYGTINIAVKLSLPLSDTGLLEALSIATQARTAAIIAAGHRVPGGRTATGTGTDCICRCRTAGCAGLRRAAYRAGRGAWAVRCLTPSRRGAAEWRATIGPQSEG